MNTTEQIHFEHCEPILRVEDMDVALAFYEGSLGFKSAPWGSKDFTFVSREGAGIYLCRGAQGRGGAWVWVGVSDVRKLYQELLGKAVKIVLPPTKYSWALEMQVEDPDGNVLRLGSDPE
jgi:predicted enzyme related to lactoylglutathione lyase